MEHHDTLDNSRLLIFPGRSTGCPALPTHIRTWR